MKKNYFFTLLLTLCFSVFSFGQVSLPHYESFEYTVGADLSAQTNWEAYSGTSNTIDIVSGNLTYSGFANPAGNSINMVGGAEDARILFSEVTTGEVYASFLMNVTDVSNITDFTDGGYFAIFASTTNSFRSRLWVKPTVDASSTTVDFAFGPASSGTGFGQSQNLNSVVLVVLSYNVETGVTNAWINPSDTDFEAGSAPTPDFTETDGSPSTIDRILLRQDSNGETPNMILDELRIGTTWASVTPSGTVSANPSLTINAPSNNAVYDSSTTEVPVTLTVENFNLSGDNGSGMTDNSGDGYIKGTLEVVGNTAEVSSFFSTNVPAIEVVPGATYNLSAELVDNSGASLSPKVEQTITFSVELPCDLQLAEITTVCDALTSGVDTYSGSIAFTGGNTGAVYTITAPSGVVVGGDDPSTAEAGTITFSGMTEAINTDITIVGDATSSCDLSRTLSSPACVSFPIVEHFDYTDASTLGSQSAWNMLNSGDEMLVASGNLDYTGLEESTGNKITFSEAGSETYTEFTDVTSGTVYASFLLKITGFQTDNADLNDGGYIAALAGTTSGYDARFWVRPNPDTSGTTFDIGFGPESSSPPFTSGTYNLNDVLFVVMAYNMDDKSVSTWVNPDASSFEGTAPTATISGTDPNPPSSINLFVLRQDSDDETPFVELDALRISNSWADVTPKAATASVAENQIEGFTTYPNPVTDNNFTVTSLSADKKQVAIFNVLGKRVFTTSFSGTKSNIDVSSISSGLYILKVTEGNKIATSKLVIK